MRVALDEVSPWGMRLIGYSIGAATLLILLKAQGRSLAIPRGTRLAAHLRRRVVSLGGVRRGRHLRPADGEHLAGHHRQLLDAGLGQPDGLFRAARAHQRAVRAGPCAVRRGPRRAGLSRGGNIYARTDRPAARARLRARLGRRHGLHEMGAHQGRPAGDHVLAGHGRRRGVRHLLSDLRGRAEIRAAAMADLGRPAVQRHARHRHRLFHLVQHHRPAVDGDGVARLADQSGGRRDRRRDHPRRPPDRAGHDRLRADLQRRCLRADPAARRSRRPIRRERAWPPSANSG